MLTGYEIEKIEDRIYSLEDLKNGIKKVKWIIPDNDRHYYADIEYYLDDILKLVINYIKYNKDIINKENNKLFY